MVLVQTNLGLRDHAGSEFDFLTGTVDPDLDLVGAGFIRDTKNGIVTYTRRTLCVMLKSCYVESSLYWLLEDCFRERRTWLVAAGSNDSGTAPS